MNGVNVMQVSVTRMQLQSDGETLVFETMLWEGLRRKIVAKVRDIEPHPEP